MPINFSSAGAGTLASALLACSVILTDSGGLQKEAYWAARPCITLRDESEWGETVNSGWNVLTGADRDLILKALNPEAPPATRPELYGDGHSATAIAGIITAALRRSPHDAPTA